MKIHDLIIFKNWADDVYISYIKDLSEAQFVEMVPNINKSIKQLLCHIYDSYWGEYHLITDRDWSNEPNFDQMSKDEIILGIEDYNNKMIEFIKNEPLNEPITLQWDENDNPVESNAEKILFNFVTHSAYHRGQMALLLRYHGLGSIKQTDYNPYLYSLGQK